MRYTVCIEKSPESRELSKGVHYVFSLKGNQGTLHDDVRAYMDDLIARQVTDLFDYYESTEKGHGRIEIRRCWSCGDVDWLNQRHAWAGLNRLVAIESTRIIGPKTTTERRYFISSHTGRCAQKLATLIGNHWRIENELHWTLDMAFNEDSCRARSANAAENLARLRGIALMLAKNEKNCKSGVKSKRAKAGYDRNYLLALLGITTYQPPQKRKRK